MTTPRDLENHAQPLAELVAYQAGSVVSRSLISKSAGTVTLFAFDQEQGLSEHTTPYDALVMAFEGDLEITVAGDRHRLSGGDLLTLPANEPHAVHANSRSKMMLVMIRE
jgi:quercetin dioxygenase-like cupin family protein